MTDYHVYRDIPANLLPRELLKLAELLHDAGFSAYLVGGTVRDKLLGLSTQVGDLDVATDARPEQVQQIFKKVIPTGLQHGTVTVLLQNKQFEVTTFRSDGVYSDGRHPDRIQYSDTIDEDLQRRDFTVNAIALNLKTFELSDPFGGITDLERGVIRAVGDPLQRFSEDGLRPLRACRFAGKLEFTIEALTLAAIPSTLEVFRKVAMERVRDELFKLMDARTPSIGFEAMRESGLLQEILPELLEGYQVEQNEYHKYDVYYHNLYACDAAPVGEPLVRFAALLHDIGKVRAARYARERENNPEINVFYNHDMIGAKMTNKILQRLKFSNHDRQHIVHLIKYHMFHYTNDWSDGAVRRLMRNVGVDNLPDLFNLRKADRAGNGKKSGAPKSLQKLNRRISKIIEEENALSVKDLDINGNILMKELQLPPGRLIGDILDHLLEQVLDDPSRNRQELLLKAAETFVTNKKQ